MCGVGGAFIIRIRFPLKGSLKGSIVGLYNGGALKIEIGSWGPLYYNYKKERQGFLHEFHREVGCPMALRYDCLDEALVVLEDTELQKSVLEKLTGWHTPKPFYAGWKGGELRAPDATTQWACADGGFALGNAVRCRRDWTLRGHCRGWPQQSLDGWCEDSSSDYEQKAFSGIIGFGKPQASGKCSAFTMSRG